MKFVTIAVIAGTAETVQASFGNHPVAARTMTVSNTISIRANREQSIARY